MQSEPVAWLRDLDGTGSLHVCSEGDPGAIAVYEDAPDADAVTLEDYFARHIEWSRETFGPALRTGGIIDHIRKELREIEAAPHDLTEWVDVIILAMDGFWMHGGKAADLLPELLAKQQKNMARTWPDWRSVGENSAIEHDRSSDTEASSPHTPICTGCKDKDGNLLFLGDRVRYRLEGPHTKQEYRNPEYEIIWDAPSFTLKYVGEGKDGGAHAFILKHGGANGYLTLVSRGAAYALAARKD